MEVIKSNKGAAKLCLDGYMYTKKKSSNTTIRWECSKRGSIKCTGAVVTDIRIQEVKRRTPHSHDPDILAIEALKVRTEIIAAAEENQSQPCKIIADKFINHPVQVRCATRKMDSLKRSVRRANNVNLPKEPSGMQDIPSPLPPQYTTNDGTESTQFLIYDNSTNDRLLLFASDTGLEILCESDTWFVDGTHGTAPSQFSQLFVVRVPLDEQSVSAVYAFLPSKEQSTYEETLSALLDVCSLKNLRPNPVTVVADYELSIHNAVKSVFDDHIHIHGCFYHLTQSTWRKIQAEGLQTIYSTQDEVKHFCGMIDGLAFLPVSDVSAGMTLLKEIVPECLNCIIDYFDNRLCIWWFPSSPWCKWQYEV